MSRAQAGPPAPLRLAGLPVPDADLVDAYRANALFDAHGEDPEFGYRFLIDEAAEAGEPMAARTAWRICSTNGWWSAFGKPKKGKAGKPGPPVQGLSDFRCNWPLAFLVVRGIDASLEGDGEGVEGCLPSDDPSCPTGAGGVE